jgi:PAS domain S-box-containing protein
VKELSGYALSPLREGPFTLYRGLCNGLAPILLVVPADEYPSLGAIRCLEHEFALRADLDGDWAARPVELLWREGRLTLVLADPGGEPLDRLLDGPMEVSEFLRIAVPLAAAVGRLHAQGLIHKDLKPANILVDTASGGVWLTGFGTASRLPREHQGPSPPEIIAGTLAYMAPEQTGRMNRSVDSRSDLYALGVAFYEMLTGALPFTASEPMEWVHCHIARQPVPPAERVRRIPAPLSAIVLKLLAKTAEDRYQTASGLAIDLQRCTAAWKASGQILPFRLGTHDASDHLMIPEKLYGREGELETLLATFDRVVTVGTLEMVLVSGYAGIGKSAVVNELHKALVPSCGLFATGKFDQYRRDIPYETLVQAFQSLVQTLLSKSDAELGQWRDAFLEALGPNGRLMVDLVPELKHIIGEPSPVPELPAQQAQVRFQLVVRRFIGVFARPEHPLALFLDDLQWLDAATLDLLEGLLTRSDLKHLMLIGAYRDNEVDDAHPLKRRLDTIRRAGARIQEIRLAPLARNDLTEMIVDALRCRPKRAMPLARLVLEKTGGNPFFARQFMSALSEDGLLHFDHDAACWRWEIDRVQAKASTDNVVDLMVGTLTRLPARTQAALQQLSCLGHVADIGMLATVLETTEEQVHSVLRDAVRLELVEHVEGSYRFTHDRVQEAAHSMVPERLGAEAHLRIGRLLAAHTPVEKREEAIFEIVNQLNRGAVLITAREEREELAELNRLAGRRAKAATAFASALAYFSTGAALLPEDVWARRHELAFSLELDRAECEFLTGALAESERRLAALPARAADTVERAAVACLSIDLYMTLDQSSRAIAVGLDCLRYLGIDWSPHPKEDEARREYEEVWRQIGSRTIESLIELPLMSDPASLATLDLLTRIAPPAFYTDVNLLALVACRRVNLILQRGNCDASCVAFVQLGLVAGARFSDYQVGFRFGQLGYDLVEERGLTRFQARTYMDLGNAVLPWTKHVREGRDLLLRAFEAANKSGDVVYAGFCCHQLNTNMLMAGDPLDDTERKAEYGLMFAQRARFGLVIDRIATQLGLIRTLRGLTPKFGCFNDSQFDESQFERHLAGNPNLVRAEFLYWVRKLQARFFAGDHVSAIEASEKAQPLQWSALAELETAGYHFYGALAHAAAWDFAPAGERARHREAVGSGHKQLQLWAVNCPDNFDNRAALVGAEMARIDGRDGEAMRLYEEAIRSAHANGFIHHEALAYELAARFYAARGFEEFANAYLRSARYRYRHWGADGKVMQLDEMYPHLRMEQPAPAPTSTIGTPIEHLDLATVIRVSETLAGEIVLEKLLHTLMQTAVTHAGAARGLLVLSRGAEPRIEAEATTTGDTVLVELRDEPVTAAALPESVLHYALRTRESVILDDAAAQSPFAGDPYLRQYQARSILCLPLITQARVIGVLYLENNLTAQVFAPARSAVLKLIASQAAIALENARLYNDLAEREARIRRLVDANIIGICISKRDGDILEANNAFLKIVGFDRDDLAAGRVRWTDLTTPESRDRTTRALDELQKTGTIQPFEKEYFRRDGSRVPVLIGVAAFDAERDHLVAFILDLTDRKRAEEELRRSEASLAQAQQISRTGSWRWTVETGEVRWSTEHFRIFSLDPQTEWPSMAVFLERVHPDDRPGLEQVLAQAVRDRSPFQHEYRVALPDGSIKYLQTVGQPDKLESGDLEFVGTVMDITERRRSEEALRNAEAELVRVARLTTMGELLASIAHEINQPLAAVATNGDACLRWLNREQPDLGAARQAASRIVQDAHRAADVIRSLRALTKKSEPQLIKLDIREAIAEVLTFTRGELHTHGVVLNTDFAAGDLSVLGDKVQLQQVLLNLIMNAVQSMAAVTGHRRELTVSVSRAEAEHLRVAVLDTCPGIDPTIALRIFEPFFTTKSDGLGLGLPICRSIIEAHGGDLRASPRAPHGTAFHFTIPIAPLVQTRAGLSIPAQ